MRSYTHTFALFAFLSFLDNSSSTTTNDNRRAPLCQGQSSEALSILAGGGNTAVSNTSSSNTATIFRLNKFVRRLYDMVKSEKDKGVVEWRRGLLVLHSTATFAKHILPKFFNTRNFKTFRRQLNYYGFVHVRSFSNTAAATTTALWVHQELAAAVHGNAEDGGAVDPDDLSLILTLRRVELNEDHKTVEGRRQRKVMALNTVEEDLQVSTSLLQRQQIQSLLNFVGNNNGSDTTGVVAQPPVVVTPTGTSKGKPSSEVAVSSSPKIPTEKMQVEPLEVKKATATCSIAPVEQSTTVAVAPMVISVPQHQNQEPVTEAQPQEQQSRSTNNDPQDVVVMQVEESCCTKNTASTTDGKGVANACDATSISSSNHSVGVVSESDEETPCCAAQAPAPKTRPPKTENSAANLLLLLSQGGDIAPPCLSATQRN